MTQPIAPTDDRRITFGGSIKMLDDNRIGGYLIRYTDADNKDLDEEYFTQATNQFEDDYPTEGLKVLFHHGLDGTLKVKPIGRIVKAENRDVGLWVEAILDEYNEYQEYVAKIKELANKGVFGWSSGALPQSVEVAEDGFIKSWAKIEASITHTPAMPDSTKIHNLKSIVDLLSKQQESIERDLGAREARESMDGTLTDLRGDVHALSQTVDTIKDSLMPEKTKEVDEKNVKASTKMTDDEMDEIVKRVLAQVASKMDMADDDMEDMEDELKSQAQAKMDDEDEMTAEKALSAVLEALPKVVQKAIDSKAQMDAQINSAIDKSLGGVMGKSKAGQGSHDPAPRIEVASKFNNWSAADFSFAADIDRLLRVKGTNLPVRLDEKFYREFADKALDGYQKREFDLSPDAVKSFRAIKTDEVMHSDLASYGDEHVPTAWRDQIWRKARRDNVVLPLMNVIEMPTNPYILPVESTDPTVYNVPETEDQSQLALTASPIPDSRIGTSNVTLTAGKLGLLTFISGELAEDSVSGAIPMYRAQAERAIMDSIDNVILNGDDATSGNINADGTTPSATAKYMIWDGLLVNAIVTNSTNAVSASGSAPTLSSIRNVRFKLDRSKQNVNNLAIFTHPEVEAKLLGMDEFVTMDKAGNRATNLNGQIGVIDGIPVFITNEIALADTDGKISNGGNGTDTGRLAIVHRPSWYLGYRRRIMTTLEYRAGWDAWTLTSTVRLAFVGQDGDSVSVLYNIGV